MFRLLKEALAAPSSPSQPRRSSTSSATTPNPDPPGKRITVSGAREGSDESQEEVKKFGEVEDWGVKRSLEDIREWTKQYRTNADLESRKLETVNTIPRLHTVQRTD